MRPFDMARAGDLIYVARRMGFLSQRELAERSGVAASTISLYEKNRRPPAYETVERLVGHCGLQLAVRFERLTRPKLPHEDWATPIEEQRDRILDVVEAFGMAAPRVLAPENAYRSATLVVTPTILAELTATETLRRALRQRVQAPPDVISAEDLRRTELNRLARRWIPLAFPRPARPPRETRFFGEHDDHDDRWYGTVIDGSRARSTRGSHKFYATGPWTAPRKRRTASDKD